MQVRRLSELRPSRLYVNSEDLIAAIDRASGCDPSSGESVPVMVVGSETVIVDGHATALAAFLNGASEIGTRAGPGEQQDMVAVQLDWCRDEGVRTVDDLEGRAVSPADYEAKWLAPYRRLQAFFRGPKPWKQTRTPHYALHYHPGTAAETDIRTIAEVQEAGFETVCQVLGVEQESEIRYFLCACAEETAGVSLEGEQNNAVAIPPNLVVALYDDDVKCIGCHEDVHLIARQALGYPPSLLLREGLAMYFDRTWWGIPNEAWVLELLDSGRYVELAVLADDDQFGGFDCTITYPIAGALVDYLVSRFGMDRFKLLYRTLDAGLDHCLRHTLGLSLTDCERGMIRRLRLLSYGDTIVRTIRSYLGTATEGRDREAANPR